MMKQIFQIIPGGKEFALQNSGEFSCAASYQGGFVMMGGRVHGKVDRWEKQEYPCLHFPLRYDSEGNYLDSLPDLLEGRYHHACTTFTVLGEEV